MIKSKTNLITGVCMLGSCAAVVATEDGLSITLVLVMLSFTFLGGYMAGQ